MQTYDVLVTKTIRGSLQVSASSFAEAEKEAYIATDAQVGWDDGEPERDVLQITKQ